MLCGFKLCCLDLYLSVRATLESVYILLSRLVLYEDCTLPDLSGVGSRPNSYLTRRQLFVAVGTPGRLGRFSLSFGLQVQRLFQAYSGPLGGIGALLEFPFESQGDILGRTNASATRIKQKKNHWEPLSLTFSINKYLELLLYLLIYRLFSEGQLGGCLTIG